MQLLRQHPDAERVVLPLWELRVLVEFRVLAYDYRQGSVSDFSVSV